MQQTCKPGKPAPEQWRRYENEKRKLPAMPPDKYQQAVKKLAERYGV